MCVEYERSDKMNAPSSSTVPEILSPIVGLWTPEVASVVCLRISWWPRSGESGQGWQGDSVDRAVGRTGWCERPCWLLFRLVEVVEWK